MDLVTRNLINVGTKRKFSPLLNLAIALPMDISQSYFKE